MTAAPRSLYGFVFAALLALSLVTTTQDALAKSTSVSLLPALFDQGLVEATKHLPRPIGRLGISWE